MNTAMQLILAGMRDDLQTVGALDDVSNRELLAQCEDTKRIMVGADGEKGLYHGIFSNAT